MSILDAIAALGARTLERTSQQGLTHNRDFLLASLRSQAFLSGDTTTDFITRITAPTAGIVTSLRVAQGDQVANGAPLVTIEPRES